MNPEKLRAEKFFAFDRLIGELTKIPQIETPTAYSDELQDAVRLRIDHPFSTRPWKILGASDVPGFYYLETSFSLGWNTDEHNEHTVSQVILYEDQFERL